VHHAGRGIPDEDDSARRNVGDRGDRHIRSPVERGRRTREDHEALCGGDYFELLLHSMRGRADARPTLVRGRDLIPLGYRGRILQQPAVGQVGQPQQRLGGQWIGGAQGHVTRFLEQRQHAKTAVVERFPRVDDVGPALTHDMHLIASAHLNDLGAPRRISRFEGPHNHMGFRLVRLSRGRCVAAWPGSAVSRVAVRADDRMTVRVRRSVSSARR
jgi:hypothetical protein